MNIEHYEAFLEHEKKGLKKQATASVRAFIESFNGLEEIENWVWENLPKLKTNNHSRIRHEIFSDLVYPILKKGYENNDAVSTLWLGKLSQNIYQARQIHKELNWVTEIGFYIKAYELDPSDEARLRLLEATVAWLEYSEHEWPSTILYGQNGATLEECEHINASVQRALELDKEQHYREFIEQFVEKLNEYKTRFSA